MAYDIIIGRDENDLKELGKKGLIFLGKTYVKMGQFTSLSNNVFLDVAKSHVILVSGKRGSGKCLHEDTLVNLGDGSVKPIKDLENDNNQIICLSNKLKIIKNDKIEFYKRKVDKLIKLKLRSGKEIKLTPEHPLLTIKGWIPVEDLNLGRKIATPRNTNSFGKEDMEEYKIKLLAYFIAESHNRQNWTLFSNADNEIIEEFKQCVILFDKRLNVLNHSRPYCFRVSRKSRLEHVKNPIISWLKDLEIHGKYAIENDIPNIVFKLKKEKLALFLNRIFSCDGGVYKNISRDGWEIDYSSSSKKLIYHVHSLLLRFGILSKIRDKNIKLNGKNFKSYKLIINIENSIRFINEIGFFGEKNSKSKRLIYETEGIKFNPNVDTIPKEIWELYGPQNLAELGRFCEYEYPKSMRERIMHSPSRQALLQISKAEDNISLRLLAESDIFWDEIVSIEYLEGEFTVYDISVPEYHNFVANDIIVHNSYGLGVIAEEMSNLPDEVKNNLAVLMIDTMGIFWTMKFPNSQQEDLLGEWNLKPKGLDVKVYTPKGKYEVYKEKNIPTDFSFSINPSELNAGDWCNVFDVKITEPIGVLIEKTINKLSNFEIDDVISAIERDKKADLNIKNATINRFEAAKSWGIFSKDATDIRDIVKGGQVSVLDVSVYEDFNIKALVTGILGKKLLNERMDQRKKEETARIRSSESILEKEKQDYPMVWILIDEAHNFLAKDKQTPSTDALVHLLREGRQPGISLVLATQQPGEIHRDVLTQSDIVISYKLTAKNDIDALNSMMQTYLTSDILSYMNDLPSIKGSGIILDDNSERIYPFRNRPKLSWHGGDAPSAVKIKKELFEEL